MTSTDKAAGHVYLAKANDDLVSHCRCARALVTLPPQMDCPWCGCGWLFICVTCHKAFTFAKAIVVAETWEETVGRELRDFWRQEPTTEKVAEAAAAMRELLRDVRVGEEYVYLDGRVVPTRAKTIQFEGWHSRHDLPFVPQVAALGDPARMDATLGDRAYWQRSAVGTD